MDKIGEKDYAVKYGRAGLKMPTPQPLPYYTVG